MFRMILSGCLALALVAQAPPPQAPEPEPSIIALPIHLDLAPLFSKAEQSAPRTPPGVETWVPLPRPPSAMYRFNLYRDPLVFRLNGNRILLRTMSFYWLEVGLKTGPYIKGLGACGKGAEGFRKVLLGTHAELSLTPTWSLDMKIQPDDPLPGNPCEITFLGYDITDKVVAGMKDNLLKATATMGQQVRESTLLRQKAEAVWAQAQQPIALADGVWLNLNPERIRLAPLSSQGKVLTITPEIQARPAITLGPPPVAATKPLPQLEPAAGSLQPGFRVRVEADLSFEHATAQLRKQIAGKRFDTEKGAFEVLDVAVFGQGDKAILELELKGRITGKLRLAGHLVYDETRGSLQLEQLDYTLESRSWITQFGEWLYRSTLRKTLQEKTNWFLDARLKNLRELTQQGLNRALVPGISLAGSLSDMKFTRPRVLPDRFRMEAILEGQLRVDVATQDLLSTLGSPGKSGQN